MLYDDPQNRAAGAAGAGMLLKELGAHHAAYAYFSEAKELSGSNDFRLAQLETGLSANPSRTLLEIDQLLQRENLRPKMRLGLLRLLAQAGQYQKLREEAKRAQCLVAPDDAQSKNYFAWLEQISGKVDPTEPDQVTVNVGVMGYKSVDRSSSSYNTGDWVQSLAALLHILRHRNITFVGADPVNDLARELAKDIEPKLHLDTPPARVRLIPVNRDSSNFGECPPQTYLICNGWYAHAVFRGVIDFPFHPNVTPIFVSFHINDPTLLTDTAVAYLKEHAPIGCRDWATVYLLRERSIPAFFTGCLTSTIGGLFSDTTQNDDSSSAGFVDCEPSPDELDGVQPILFSHRDLAHRGQSLTDALQSALDLLGSYRQIGRIVTSRLHCYYPARSMGIPVAFRPKSASDIRFEGLLNVDDTEFANMRTKLEDKLAEVSTHILSGTTPERFRAFWQQLWKTELEHAEAYCGQFPPAPVASFDPVQVSGSVPLHHLTNFVVPQDDARTPVTVLLCADANQFAYLQVAFAALRQHTPGPIDCHLFTRGVTNAEAASAFAIYQGAETRITQYDLSQLSYAPGSIRQRLSHLSVSAFDRVLAPHLLPEVDRVLYMDVDTLARADLRPLFETELEDAPLAARASVAKGWATAEQVLRDIVKPLPASEAWALSRRLHHSGPLSVPAFNSGVMVMNLQHMRAEGMASKVISLIENSGCHDQDALSVHYRGKIKWLEPEWNYVPAQDYHNDPKIVHWAGPVKPWHTLYSHYSADWKALHNSVMRRGRG